MASRVEAYYDAIDEDLGVLYEKRREYEESVQLFPHYEVADLWADASGHNVVQTVFAQCGECYRTDGPEALKPVGETEWVEGLAQQTEKAPGKPTIGAIFGTAKLSLGEGHQRQVFAGIKQAYKPGDLIGRHVVMVANLAPRKMRFGVSEGRVLGAGPGGEDIFLVSPDSGAGAGMKVK